MSQRKQSVGLLEIAEADSQYHACNGAQKNDQTAFIQEDAFYLTVVCSQMAQRLYILTLVDDQHDQRTDDIETGNDQNKSQEK